MHLNIQGGSALSKTTPSAGHPAAGDAEPGPSRRPEPTTPIVRRGEDGWGGAAAGPAAEGSSTEQGGSIDPEQAKRVEGLPFDFAQGKCALQC